MRACPPRTRGQWPAQSMARLPPLLSQPTCRSPRAVRTGSLRAGLTLFLADRRRRGTATSRRGCGRWRPSWRRRTRSCSGCVCRRGGRVWAAAPSTGECVRVWPHLLVWAPASSGAGPEVVARRRWAGAWGSPRPRRLLVALSGQSRELLGVQAGLRVPLRQA